MFETFSAFVIKFYYDTLCITVPCLAFVLVGLMFWFVLGGTLGGLIDGIRYAITGVEKD